MQDRVDVKLKSEDETKALMGKFENLSDICGYKINEILKLDGVKFFFDEASWILMRKSGTEPLLRFYIEASDEKKLQDIKEFIKSKI